jgi:hypothetical protein
MLLVQGQAEVPSVADLLAGRPVTTRGYSWDYVPAKQLAAELAERDDVAACKLFQGRTTLVHASLWPAVHAIAHAARATVLSSESIERVRLLEYVEGRPGASGDDCKLALALDAPGFRRAKHDLERWLCVWSDERDDVEVHTHDRAWFPWTTGKIAREVRTTLSLDDATSALIAVAGRESEYPALALVRRGRP